MRVHLDNMLSALVNRFLFLFWSWVLVLGFYGLLCESSFSSCLSLFFMFLPFFLIFPFGSLFPVFHVSLYPLLLSLFYFPFSVFRWICFISSRLMSTICHSSYDVWYTCVFAEEVSFHSRVVLGPVFGPRTVVSRSVDVRRDARYDRNIYIYIYILVWNGFRTTGLPHPRSSWFEVLILIIFNFLLGPWDSSSGSIYMLSQNQFIMVDASSSSCARSQNEQRAPLP